MNRFKSSRDAVSQLGIKDRLPRSRPQKMPFKHFSKFFMRTATAIVSTSLEAKSMKNHPRLTFDELPDIAFVGVPVGVQLSKKGRSKVYVESRLGLFPPIVKIGHGRSSGIRVGELRRYLNDPQSYRATS